jgi:endonuclease/exonuclease/phosphatase (EEP) superfamily protein YafD
MPRRFRRVGREWLVGLCLAAMPTAAGLLMILAVPLRINRIVPFAAFLGPRNGLTVLTCAGCVFAAAASLWRWGRPIATPLALGLLIPSVISATVVGARGFADPEPAPLKPGQLRILSWNTNGDLVDPSDIAALAARFRANIVVLPDANIAWTASSYVDAFWNVKYPMRLVAMSGRSTEIAVFAAAPYSADYFRVQPGPDPDKTLRITSDTANLPTILALHTPQPTLHGTQQWNTELNWVADQCRSGQVVAVGDFNATVDSFGTPRLGNCVDAASTQHASSVGTWPTIAPIWLGMPIDHILATSGWRTQTFTVLTDQDGSGARHRPIFAVLAR